MNTALKMILSGVSTAILLILMIWKGFENAPIFESVGAEITFASILFVATMLLIIAGIKELYEGTSRNKPQKF